MLVSHITCHSTFSGAHKQRKYMYMNYACKTSLNICFPFPVLVTSDFASFIYTTFKSDLSRNVYYWKREGGREGGGEKKKI